MLWLQHVALVICELPHCIQAPHFQVASRIPALGVLSRLLVAPTTVDSRPITYVRMLKAHAHRHAPRVEDWERRMEVQSLHIRAVAPQHRDGIGSRFAHCRDQ